MILPIGKMAREIREKSVRDGTSVCADNVGISRPVFRQHFTKKGRVHPIRPNIASILSAAGPFFDRQRVMSGDRATRKVFSKFGAFVRQTARSSIRKRKSISEPGQPPSSHTGLLKRNIFFVFAPAPSV